MKTKLLLTTALLALSCGALAGCNNNTATDNSIHVIFWHTFGDKAETALKKKADTFVELVKKNEGVDVTVELSHLGGYTDVIRIVGTALESGNGPTMTISYPDSIAALMSRESTPGQYIVKMDDYFNNADYGFGTDTYLGDNKKGTSDFIQSYLEEGQAFPRSGTYVMPYMKSSEVMMYNVEAATAAMKIYKPELTGTAVTEFLENMSFNELMELAKVCVENKDKLGFGSMTYPVFYDSDSNMLITQLEQKGLVYSEFDESGNPVLGLDKTVMSENEKEVEALLEQYADWHASGLLTTKATEGTYASDSFKNQKCFFTIGSSGGAGYTFPSSGQFTLGVCRVPYAGENSETPSYISQGPSIAFCNDKSLSSSANSKRLEYAWKFYKYITSTNVNVELCVNGSEGYVPVRTSCYSSEIWGEFLEEGGNYAETAKVLKDVINGHFITSCVFNGSAEYRNQMTTLVGASMKDKSTISKSISDAVNNTKNAMK